MIAGVAYGGTGFVVFVAAIMLHVHLVRRRFAPVPHILALWLVLAVSVVGGVLWLEPGHGIALAATNLFVYLFLGELLLFVYAASIGSISIRLLVTMHGLGLLPEPLRLTLARHTPGAFLDIRLGTLLAKDLLVQRDDRYEITTRGRRWARGVSLLKRLFAVGAGG
jgi:hypothetical protein